MLSAYVNASDMHSAQKFFRRVKQDGLSHNEVTYGALIKGYAKANDIGKMMAKHEEMRSSGKRANQMVLTTIMDAYGKNKDFNSAVIWYKEMEPSGVASDKKAKNILPSLAKSDKEQRESSMLVGNKDWQDGVPGSNAKLMTFACDKAVDEDDDDQDDGADDDEDDNSDFSENAGEAFSIGVERAPMQLLSVPVGSGQDMAETAAVADDGILIVQGSIPKSLRLVSEGDFLQSDLPCPGDTGCRIVSAVMRSGGFSFVNIWGNG